MRGFTQPEQRAILVLLSTFGLGTLLWWYRQSQPLPVVEPATVAAFEEFARGLPGDSIRAPASFSERGAGGSALSARLDLNAATINDLVRFPGIGPVMAKRIVEYRETNGPFKKLQDLRKVKGIGVKTYEKLAPLVMIR
ncbi:MAG: helix-hairpin-helix domain-containing protein [candidate division KSB1 bacterium]|nr:helix-hairpin-helix domain-containing protein [candidate division KSB1 bacterium]MDZ7364898.1 helix-hairpin-helix domain-containing protein [candidate division KSB1 bacterium]MDZ7403000.1 helix-hairpin-helix domain-containing protein [candidate division KSB1 bacterium]